MVDNCGSIPEMVDVNPEDDHRELMEKGLGPTGSSSESGNSGGTPSAIQVVGANGNTKIVVSNPNNEPTEKHHIVEQCQAKKSGFSHGMIQDGGNIVEIPYLLHRMISGYFSSLYEGQKGVRVRDHLAGQSFEEQRQFGIEIIKKLWEELYGGKKR